MSRTCLRPRSYTSHKLRNVRDEATLPENSSCEYDMQQAYHFYGQERTCMRFAGNLCNGTSFFPGLHPNKNETRGVQRKQEQNRMNSKSETRHPDRRYEKCVRKDEYHEKN